MTIHPHVSDHPADIDHFRAPRWERRQTAAWGGLTLLAALLIAGLIWFDVGRDAQTVPAGVRNTPAAKSPAPTH